MCHGLGDGAHAADGVAPGALDATRLAEDMVEEDIGAARRVGAGEMADNGIKAQHRLDRIAFEPAIEIFARRTGEQGEEIALFGLGQPQQRPALGGQRGQPLQPAPRRGFEREAAHLVGQHLQPGVIGGQGGCVPGREARHFGLRLPGADVQIIAIERQEIVEGAQHDPEAVIGQPHIGRDLFLQQRDGVAGGGVAEARREFLGDAGAADDVARFADVDLQPRPGEIEGGDQPVVAAADDDRIVSHGRQPCRAAGGWSIKAGAAPGVSRASREAPG